MYMKNEQIRRNEKLKIVFMGTPSYATRILEALMKAPEYDVSLLVTQEDKPVGRKQILTPPDTKAWALTQAPSLAIFQPKTLRSEEAQEKIASYHPDVIIVAAYGQILPKAILEIAPCINLHASLLPKYRGASPIQSTLLENEPYAGVTSMLMEEGLDTGAILGLTYLKPAPQDTAEALFEKLADTAATLTLLTLKYFDQAQPWNQLDADASYCKKIKKEYGLISWEQTALHLACQYKAFTPWPGIYLESGLKIIELQLLETASTHLVNGTILEVRDDGVVLACHQGTLLISKLQPPSKTVMSANDYLRGKRLICGNVLV